MKTERTFNIKEVTIGLLVGLLIVIGFITCGTFIRGNDVNAMTLFEIEENTFNDEVFDTVEELTNGLAINQLTTVPVNYVTGILAEIDNRVVDHFTYMGYEVYVCK